MKIHGIDPDTFDAAGHSDGSQDDPSIATTLASSKFEGVEFYVSSHDDCIWIDAKLDTAPMGSPAREVHARFKNLGDDRCWDIFGPKDSDYESEDDASREAWGRFRQRLADIVGIDVPESMYPGAA